MSTSATSSATSRRTPYEKGVKNGIEPRNLAYNHRKKRRRNSSERTPRVSEPATCADRDRHLPKRLPSSPFRLLNAPAQRSARVLASLALIDGAAAPTHLLDLRYNLWRRTQAGRLYGSCGFRYVAVAALGIGRWRATCRRLHSGVGGQVSLPVARKPPSAQIAAEPSVWSPSSRRPLTSGAQTLSQRTKGVKRGHTTCWSLVALADPSSCRCAQVLV